MATINLGRVGFVNKGAHNIATAYKVNDVVTYNSGTYACIQAHTGQLPTATAYWQNWVANDKALDSAVVHKTGDETIGGVKSFTDGVKVQNQNVSPFSGFKNYIINGNFDVWQRDTSQTSSGYGSDDRWRNDNVGSTKTHSQVSCTDTEKSLFSANSFSRTIVTSVAGAGNYVNKQQKIEDVTKLAGKTVTLSFWAKADSNKNINITFSQTFGSGGSPSATVGGIGAQTIALTTTWQKKSITVTLPSIVGKTIGTDGAHTSFIGIAFWFEAGSNFISTFPTITQQSGTFDIAQVQLEEGSVATPFENRPYGLELSLCQRYLPVVTYDLYSAFVGQCISTTQALIKIPFKTVPRVPPTGIIITSANGIVQIANSVGGGITTTAPATLHTASYNGASLMGTVANGLFAGDACTVNIQGNILFTGCEL